MTRGSRHGQIQYDLMTAPSSHGRVSHSNVKNNIGFMRRVPKWYVCDAVEFERVWLPQFESGKLPRPTKAEMAKYDQLMLHAETEEEEVEEDESISIPG